MSNTEKICAENARKLSELEELTERVLNGYRIDRKEAIRLFEMPLEELCHAANRIRIRFCGNAFDLCTIVNGKSGLCSENCKFCAQSAQHGSCANVYPLLSCEELLAAAKRSEEAGAMRFSVVTSGKRLSDTEVDAVCRAVRRIKAETKLSVCASLGLLSKEQFLHLKDAGVSRIHNNLETSERNFPNVCTTHRFEEKINVIRMAKEAGLTVCSGGIIGIGETIEDRVDMALVLREWEIGSVPVNLLNPIPGTPFENNPVLSEEELRQTVAVFRFILPTAAIRLAGGRGLLPDKGKSCFLSGANAAISGDMLTTSGIGVKTDIAMIKELF